MLSEDAPEAENILDCAALHTFLNSGTVYAVPSKTRCRRPRLCSEMCAVD